MSPQCPTGRESSALLPPLLLSLVTLVGAFLIGTMPREGQTQYAVIAAPWAGLAEMVGLVAAADGAIVNVGGLSNVIIAQSDSATFSSDLYRAGAWLVLDPIVLRGCLGIAAAHHPAQS
ncbi:hypothetical protein C8P66_1057 [Humitalea rosea]|uniref:Uncharacterized protein n=2 Tax=Humitalea rosea TaxID=990373 RepID=A0A2W7IM77_9PROT|nr:hypothetical protein C8P66_1057 [Humitalea rosea]